MTFQNLLCYCQNYTPWNAVPCNTEFCQRYDRTPLWVIDDIWYYGVCRGNFLQVNFEFWVKQFWHRLNITIFQGWPDQYHQISCRDSLWWAFTPRIALPTVLDSEASRKSRNSEGCSPHWGYSTYYTKTLSIRLIIVNTFLYCRQWLMRLRSLSIHDYNRLY